MSYTSGEESGAQPAQPPGGSSELFTRKATGLVRNVSPVTSLIINFTPGNPIQAVGAGLLFALSLFPGGNIFIGVLLILPMMLSFSYAYGLLTASMPRTGGDYTLVSRILHPAAGVTVAFFQGVAQFLSVAFFAIAFVQIGLSPAFGAWGIIDHHPTLVQWSTTLATSHAWQMGLGVVMIAITSAMMAGGWGWTSKALLVLASFTMIGLVLSVLVVLFTSHGGFVSDFNSVVRPYTHSADSYGGVLATAHKAGVNLAPAFSFAKTIPLIGVMSLFAIYTYFSTYVGGELRNGKSMSTANRMAGAGTLNLTIVVIVVLIFFHVFSNAFLTAAFGGGMPTNVPVPPFYFFLAGVILHSGFLAFVLGLSFAMFWPVIGFVAFLQPVRTSFAFGVDGIFPKGVMKLSRSHAPYVAVLATAALAILTLAWGIYISKSFLVVIVYGTITALVAMTILGVAAFVFPWRRPEMYRASVTQARWLGVPVVSIAGLGAVASGITIVFIYFHYPQLGLANYGQLWTWVIATFVAALAFYFGAVFYRRRQGTDLSHVFNEIPPE